MELNKRRVLLHSVDFCILLLFPSPMCEFLLFKYFENIVVKPIESAFCNALPNSKMSIIRNVTKIHHFGAQDRSTVVSDEHTE